MSSRTRVYKSLYFIGPAIQLAQSRSKHAQSYIPIRLLPDLTLNFLIQDVPPIKPPSYQHESSRLTQPGQRQSMEQSDLCVQSRVRKHLSMA